MVGSVGTLSGPPVLIVEVRAGRIFAYPSLKRKSRLIVFHRLGELRTTTTSFINRWQR